MLLCIFRPLDPLLRLDWPSLPGRHRLPRSGQDPTLRPPVLPLRHTRAPEPCPPGEDGPLVRPYLVVHEEREEARRQRARRRALWLAVHGVDIGPCPIHGVEVTA